MGDAGSYNSGIEFRLDDLLLAGDGGDEDFSQTRSTGPAHAGQPL
jgi:hypothetical protein